MIRRLTPEETHLWRIVTSNVKPLTPTRRAPPKRRSPSAAKEALLHHVIGVCGTIERSSVPPAAPPAVKFPLPTPEKRRAPFAMDPREKRDLRKGKQPIEAVLDLHGLRAQEAHDRLVDFLMGAQSAGRRFALVITGKGGGAISESFFAGEGGVLRRQTPHWLSGPKLRGIVAGFEEAAPSHGGGGALYVRLRRLRKS